MEHAKKMFLVPESSLENNSSTSLMANQTKKTQTRNPFDRFEKMLKIVLKIAAINGYNEDVNIRGLDGSFLQNSSIIQLLNFAVTKTRIIVGENDFVQLLFDANVPTDLITNENIKSKLNHIGRKSEMIIDSKPYITRNISKPIIDEEEDIKPTVKSSKRKLEESDEEIPRKKQNIDWITADGISSDEEF